MVNVRGLTGLESADPVRVGDRLIAEARTAVPHPAQPSGELPASVNRRPLTGQRGHWVRMRGPQQPDTAFRGGGEPVSVVLASCQAVPGLRRYGGATGVKVEYTVVITAT